MLESAFFFSSTYVSFLVSCNHVENLQTLLISTIKLKPKTKLEESEG